ncbi:MAG TPA: ureidoglycolate lyase [Gammaproteobacteria bacterium]|nr:ureidoglycolate lyase [Gammaproteobacteria bacterium]
MTHIDIKLEPLTREAFKPFGDVIELNESNDMFPINFGLTERHHALSRVDVADGGGEPIISLFENQPASLPIRVKVMERHPLGSQAFIAISGNPYVIVVGEAGDFDHTKLHAFLAQSSQAINYYKGTWHHYCLGLNAVNQFVVVDRGGTGDNCDESEIPDDVVITVNH